jgi:hypothetical protein
MDSILSLPSPFTLARGDSSSAVPTDT